MTATPVDPDTPRAFDEASGRARAREGTDPAARDAARRILALRRLDADAERCPPAARARARGLWGERAAARAGGLLRRVPGVAAAVRGAAARAAPLRFEAGGLRLDVRVARDGARVDVHVEGAPPGSTLALEAPPHGPVPVAIDASGTGACRPPRDARHARFVLRTPQGATWRTGSIPLQDRDGTGP